MILFYLNNQRRFFTGSVYLNGDPCILICDEQGKSYGLATKVSKGIVPEGKNQVQVNNPSDTDLMTRFLVISGVAKDIPEYEHTGERVEIINEEILAQIHAARMKLEALPIKG